MIGTVIAGTGGNDTKAITIWLGVCGAGVEEEAAEQSCRKNRRFFRNSERKNILGKGNTMRRHKDGKPSSTFRELQLVPQSCTLEYKQRKAGDRPET